MSDCIKKHWYLLLMMLNELMTLSVSFHWFTFGFKSKHHPTQSTEIQYFEKGLLDMIKSLKFRNFQDHFQTKIKNDILKIQTSADVFAFADKTANLYEILPNDYKWLLHEYIIKIYKTFIKGLENTITMQAKHTAKKHQTTLLHWIFGSSSSIYNS